MSNLYCHSKEHKIIILLLISFVSWESSAIDDTLRVLSITEFATDLGNSLHEANLLMVLISDSNLFVEQIQDACEASNPLSLYVQDTKLVKSIHRMVCNFIRW